MSPAALVFRTNWRRRLFGHQGAWPLRGLAGVLLVGSALLLAWELSELAREHRRHDEAVQALQAAQAALKPAVSVAKRPPPRLNASQARRLDGIIQQLNTPWTTVLDGLERHTRPDIGVTLMEPDASKATIRIQAEAKSIDSLLGYAQGFAQDPAFGGVLLQQHETNEQDPNRPARLGFEVRLKPAPVVVGGGAP